MFSWGFWEILLIIVVALLILGPKRLPCAAKAAGRWFNYLQHTWQQCKHALTAQGADKSDDGKK